MLVEEEIILLFYPSLSIYLELATIKTATKLQASVTSKLDYLAYYLPSAKYNV